MKKKFKAQLLSGHKDHAVEVPWSVYQLAMRDDLLPRFAKADMPSLPPAPPAATPAPANPQPKPSGKPKSKNSRKRIARA
jgi:hypothetical protein